MGSSRRDEHMKEGFISHRQRIPFESWTDIRHRPRRHDSHICFVSLVRERACRCRADWTYNDISGTGAASPPAHSLGYRALQPWAEGSAVAVLR